MSREVTTGNGFESIRTYHRNNPNIRSSSTTSNNNNNFSQFSGNANFNQMFPPGFPFHNIGGNSSSYGMPFGNGGVSVESRNDGRRGRNSQRNRNNLGQIFGFNNQNFDTLYFFIYV